MDMSCFADCNSQSLVMRVPYDFAVEMLSRLPPSERKDELLRRMKIAATRSKAFSKLLQSFD